MVSLRCRHREAWCGGPWLTWFVLLRQSTFTVFNIKRFAVLYSLGNIVALCGYGDSGGSWIAVIAARLTLSCTSVCVQNGLLGRALPPVEEHVPQEACDHDDRVPYFPHSDAGCGVCCTLLRRHALLPAAPPLTPADAADGQHSADAVVLGYPIRGLHVVLLELHPIRQEDGEELHDQLLLIGVGAG